MVKLVSASIIYSVTSLQKMQNICPITLVTPPPLKNFVYFPPPVTRKYLHQTLFHVFSALFALCSFNFLFPFIFPLPFYFLNFLLFSNSPFHTQPPQKKTLADISPL